LALFLRERPISSLAQDPIWQHHDVLPHAFNYMRANIHCKGNAGTSRSHSNNPLFFQLEEERRLVT
jgi:hypothetical protein